jgi:hypothetical protein
MSYKDAVSLSCGAHTQKSGFGFLSSVVLDGIEVAYHYVQFPLLFATLASILHA